MQPANADAVRALLVFNGRNAPGLEFMYCRLGILIEPQADSPLGKQADDVKRRGEATDRNAKCAAASSASGVLMHTQGIARDLAAKGK